MAVQFRFTGDDKDVQRALQAMEKRYNDLINTTKKGTDETKKMADAAKKAFDDTRTPMEQYAKKMQELNALLKEGAISQDTFGRAAKKANDELAKSNKPADGLVKSALAAASGYLSVAAAIQQVVAALQRKSELERAAGDKQQAFANMRRETLINLGTATESERKQIFGAVDTISKKRGVKPTDLEATLPALTSAQAGLTIPQMIEGLDMAATVAPHSPDTMTELARGLEKTALLTGSKDPRVNMGFQLGIGRGTEIKNLGDINRYLIRGALNVKGHGGTASDAAAVVSALTSTIGDPEGRISQTAAANLADALDDFLPTVDRYGKKDEHGRRKLEARGTGLTDTMSRIKKLQNDPELRELFMATASFEAQAKIPIRDMLTAGTENASILEQRRREIPQGVEAIGIAQGFQEMLANDPSQQAAASVRRGEAITERMQLEDEFGGRRARAHKMMIDALNASGDWSTLQAEAQFLVQRNKDPEDVAIGQLRRRRSDIDWWPGETAADTKRMAGLDEVIAELRAIKENQRNRNPKNHAE